MKRKRLIPKTIAAAVFALALLGTLMVSLPASPTLAAHTAPDPAKPGWDIHYVDDWTSFRAAWNNNTSCSKIVLLGDIAAPVSTSTGNGSDLSSRTRPLEVDGQGFFLNLYNMRMNFSNSSSVSYDPTFDIHDIRLRKNTSQSYMSSTTNSNTNGILYEQSSGGTGRWIYRVGNVTVNPGDANHFAQVSGSHLILYGENRITTASEFGHVSSVFIEPGSAQFITEIGRQDYSIFYFNTAAATAGTAYRYGRGNFEVGQYAIVVLTYSGRNAQGTQISGVRGRYPAIYQNFNSIIIHENASFSATMVGSAIQFNNSNQSFLAKRNSRINLTSLISGQSTVCFSHTNGSFVCEEGAEVYIVGDNAYNGTVTAGTQATATSTNTRGVIGSTRGANNSVFRLIKPALFDIRNKNAGAGTASSADRGQAIWMPATGCVFEIGSAADPNNKSDIDIWAVGSNLKAPSDVLSYMDADIRYDMNNNTTNGVFPTSGTIAGPLLSQTNIREGNFRRITGMNQTPEVLFDDADDLSGLVKNPEDADKYVRVRAVIGWVPDDDGVDESGHVEMIPVYASGAQGVEVWITSEDGSVETSDYMAASNAQEVYVPSNHIVGCLPGCTLHCYTGCPPGCTLHCIQSCAPGCAIDHHLYNCPTVCSVHSSHKLAACTDDDCELEHCIEDGCLPGCVDDHHIVGCPSGCDLHCYKGCDPGCDLHCLKGCPPGCDLHCDASCPPGCLVHGHKDWFLTTDANGYLLLPPGYPTPKFLEFLQAGTLLTARANRGGRMGEEFTARVKDVTPPAPAKINGLLMRGQTVITGYDGEPGAKVTLCVNGGPELPVSATVNGAGNWSVTLPGGVNLATGDLVRIYMADRFGNKNPWPNDVPYHDAVFPKASQFEVQELPAQLHVRQIVLAGEENRSVPEAGYVTALKRSGSNATLEAVNFSVNSGTDESATPYTYFTYPPMQLDNVLLRLADPQYYSYIGYQMTDADAQTPGAVTAGDPNFAIGPQTEKWITLYVEPRANGTSYYAKDAVDNDLGEVHLPVPPAMSLAAYNVTAGENIGYIARNSTIRIPGQNAPQTITITAEAWGDGISSDNMNWSRVSGAAWGTLPVDNAPTLSITIPGGNVNGSMRISAESAHDPTLRMEFTIQVIDLIVMYLDLDIEMTQNLLYITSSPGSPTILNFGASKAVDWRIRSQTGARASLSSPHGTLSSLIIPANYRGTINVRVASGSLVRNFRIVVRR